jgi:NAD(P)-dependent dehydrogenase (short-subunit alcohol dehydrogenase family)
VRSLAAQQSVTEAEVERGFFASARPTSLLGRFADPDEIASMIVYASSAAASATTGASLRVDGGVVRAIA